MNQQTKELKVFNNQYAVQKKLSSGSFGVVFQGEDKLSGEPVALKIEKNRAQILQRLQNILGIPKLYWQGTEGNYNILVITLLGRDLAHYIKVLKKFSLKTLLMLGEQLLTTLEQCHNRAIVHRDMKPENVMISRDLKTIYLVDFGISKVYKDSQGVHIPFREDKPFIGTTRYAPIGAHKGQELARADDLESLGYMLVYLYKGVLPWQNMQNVSDRDKAKAVGKMKMNMNLRDLCKDMPNMFVEYFEYVKQLQFKQNPDYKFLLKLFRECAKDNDIIFDYKYDWFDTKEQQKGKLQAQQQPLKKKDSERALKLEKKGSFQHQEVASQQSSSKYDLLRPPAHNKKKKGSDRTPSISSLAPSLYSAVNTFQSSLANKYQGSFLVNDFGEEKSQKGQKQKQQKQKSKKNLLKSDDVDNDLEKWLSDEVNLGPSLQYESLVKCQVNAQFKQQIRNRKQCQI